MSKDENTPLDCIFCKVIIITYHHIPLVGVVTILLGFVIHLASRFCYLKLHIFMCSLLMLCNYGILLALSRLIAVSHLNNNFQYNNHTYYLSFQLANKFTQVLFIIVFCMSCDQNNVKQGFYCWFVMCEFAIKFTQSFIYYRILFVV